MDTNLLRTECAVLCFSIKREPKFLFGEWDGQLLITMAPVCPVMPYQHKPKQNRSIYMEVVVISQDPIELDLNPMQVTLKGYSREAATNVYHPGTLFCLFFKTCKI